MALEGKPDVEPGVGTSWLDKGICQPAVGLHVHVGHVDLCDICQNLLDHLAVERRGYSLVLEELDPVITSSLVGEGLL